MSSSFFVLRCSYIGLRGPDDVRQRSTKNEELMLDVLRRARKIGFLFSGGSSRCAFQIGVAEALQELDVRPAICLGVSGGAWNAAAVAVGNTHRLRAYWKFFMRLPCLDITNL